VRGYLDELIEFIHADDGNQYPLIRTALAHHRFAWIHPFRNGNGRVVRVLHYAMLMQQDFNFARAGIINPSAVFFSDRDLYYSRLSEGDKGTDDGLLVWCQYVIDGISGELQKVEKLLDYDYLKTSILIPAIKTCASRGELSKDEEKILLLAAEKQVIAAADVDKAMTDLLYQTVLRRMKILRDRGLLGSSRYAAKSYRLQFADNTLMRSIVSQLRIEGFFSGLNDAG
jgi:Fic family protein